MLCIEHIEVYQDREAGEKIDTAQSHKPKVPIGLWSDFGAFGLSSSSTSVNLAKEDEVEH